jgi:hypothetical protein
MQFYPLLHKKSPFFKQLSREALKVLHDTGCPDEDIGIFDWPLDAGCF